MQKIENVFSAKIQNNNKLVLKLPRVSAIFPKIQIAFIYIK